MKNYTKPNECLEKIDLCNFESSVFDNVHYVLTSPRSLEACRRLNIKPVELLYKPLSTFRENSASEDVPLRTIYNCCNEHEQLRLRKLSLCQKERCNIVKDITNENYALHDTEDTDDEMKFISYGMRKLSREGMNKSNTELSTDNTNWKFQSKQLNNTTTFQDNEISTRKPSHMKANRILSRSKSDAELYKKLPAKDRKILDLMMLKHEKERQQINKCVISRRQWEEERNHRSIDKTLDENRRRCLISEEMTLQTKRRELKMLLRINKEALMKVNQEHNRKLMDKEEEDVRHGAVLLNDLSHARAMQRREMALLRQSTLRTLHNRRERMSFQQRRKALQKAEETQCRELQFIADQRHRHVEQNLANSMLTRQSTLLDSSHVEHVRQGMAHRSKNRQDVAMTTWKENVLLANEMADEQVKRSVRLNMMSRANTVRHDRLAHQAEQKRNIGKLVKERRLWHLNLIENLQEKEDRVKELQLTKDEYILQTRATAQLSHLLRDKVRSAYDVDNFNRKVLEAQLSAKLENSSPVRRAQSAAALQ